MNTAPKASRTPAPAVGPGVLLLGLWGALASVGLGLLSRYAPLTVSTDAQRHPLGLLALAGFGLGVVGGYGWVALYPRRHRPAGRFLRGALAGGAFSMLLQLEHLPRTRWWPVLPLGWLGFGVLWGLVALGYARCVGPRERQAEHAA